MSDGTIDERIAAARREVQRLREAGDRPGLAVALLYLSAHLQNAGRFDESIAAASESVDLHAELGERPGLAWALENLASRYSAAGRHDQAVAASRRHVAVLRELDEPRGLASALLFLSAYLQHAGQFDDAVAAAEEAVGVFTDLDRPGLAWALENLASRYSAAGRHDDSVMASEGQVAVLRELDEPRALASALLYLSAYRQHAKRFDDAIAAATEAVGIFTDLDRPGLAWALENLASRYSAAGRHAEAVAASERHVAVAREIGDQRGVASALVYLSAYRQHAGRPDDGVVAVQEAVRLYSTVDDRPGAAWALENLAYRLQAADRTWEAVASAERSRDLYTFLARTVPAHQGNADRLADLVDALRGGTGLVASVTAADTVPSGGSIDVTVELAPRARDAVVRIAGLPGPRQTLQAPARPGPWAVQVVAESGGTRDARTHWVLVGAGATAVPALAARRDPAAPMAVALALPAAAFPAGTSFRWTVGPLLQTGADPSFTVDVDSLVDHGRLVTPVPVEVVATGAGQPVTIRRTLSVWSSYQLIRQGGQVSLPVRRVTGLPSAGQVRVEVTVVNPGPDPVALTSWQRQFLVDDEDAPLLPEPPVPLDRTLNPGEHTLTVDVSTVDNPGADACLLTFTGTAGALPASLVAVVELNDVSGRGLLRRAAGGRELFDAGLAAEPVEGDRCDPFDLPQPVPDGWACQFNGAWEERWLSGRIMNARKGDIILAPGGDGTIGGLLKRVVPTQRYAHTGICTRNRVEVAHCTGSMDWLKKQQSGGLWSPPFGDEPAPSEGFDPAALKYVWPGGIVQSAEEAMLGSDFRGPDGADYTLNCLTQAGFAEFDTGWEVIPPLVIKPPPLLETPAVRADLHRVADLAREMCVTAEATRHGHHSRLHYRFYGYTDASVDSVAPAGSGWADGTRPAVCSSFIWMAARAAGVQLEGAPEPEPGAETTAGTPDGLYLYTAGERAVAGDWFYGHFHDEVTTALREQHPLGDVGAALWNAFSDMADDVANQILNTFAHDWADTAAKDSTRWRDEPRDGVAVSPDNLMSWDSPATGGRWGHREPLLYRPGRMVRMPVSVWRAVRERGDLTGTVRFRGQPAAGADVSVDGRDLNADGAGRFGTRLFVGDYVVHAGLAVPGVGYVETTVPVHVDGDGTHVDIDLQPPPDVFRRLIITGTGSISDDETFGDDETEAVGFRREIDVQPWSTHGEWTFSQGVGGEVLGVLRFTADLLPDRSVSVRLRGELFEGTDEQPDDLEMTMDRAWNVRPDETVTDWIYIWNEDEGVSDDRISVNLVLVNDRQP